MDANLTYIDTLPELFDMGPPLISDKTMELVMLYVLNPILLLLSFVGTVTNIVTIIIFGLLGVTDGLSTIFVAIAVSDFLQGIGAAIWSVGSYMSYFPDPDYAVNPKALSIITAGYKGPFFNTSMTLATVMSIERCLVVALPLRFRGAMSKGKAYIFIFLSYSLCIASFSPYYAVSGFKTGFDPSANRTRTIMWVREDWVVIRNYVNLITLEIFSIAIQAIVIITTAVLIRALRRSRKFRQSQAQNQQGAERKRGRVLEREKVVTQMVLFVGILLVIFNTPILTITVIFHMFPKISVVAQYYNLSFLLFTFDAIFLQIGAACNFFIYYALNVPFQTKTKQIFRCLVHHKPKDAADVGENP